MVRTKAGFHADAQGRAIRRRCQHLPAPQLPPAPLGTIEAVSNRQHPSHSHGTCLRRLRPSIFPPAASGRRGGCPGARIQVARSFASEPRPEAPEEDRTCCGCAEATNEDLLHVMGSPPSRTGGRRQFPDREADGQSWFRIVAARRRRRSACTLAGWMTGEGVTAARWGIAGAGRR